VHAISVPCTRVGSQTVSQPVYMIKTKVAFSNQLKLFEYLLNCSDWLNKSWPFTKATTKAKGLSELIPELRAVEQLSASLTLTLVRNDEH